MGISAVPVSQRLIQDVQGEIYQLVFASAKGALERNFIKNMKQEGIAPLDNHAAVIYLLCLLTTLYPGSFH